MCETERLRLCELCPKADRAFILQLVNEPSWLRFIGDRGVCNLDDAERYIREGPVRSYRAHGHGLYRVDRKSDDASMGLCGLIRRPGLDDVDLGFAFLPAFWGQGYAYEAAAGVLAYTKTALRLSRVVAICTLDNTRSIHLLQRLGFVFEENIKLPNDDETLARYACPL